MQGLPRIETLEQARELLLGMEEQQEITTGTDEQGVSVKKHSDHEFGASLPDLETGVISLRDASHILLEHGGRELYLG